MVGHFNKLSITIYFQNVINKTLILQSLQQFQCTKKGVHWSFLLAAFFFQVGYDFWSQAKWLLWLFWDVLLWSTWRSRATAFWKGTPFYIGHNYITIIGWMQPSKFIDIPKQLCQPWWKWTNKVTNQHLACFEHPCRYLISHCFDCFDIFLCSKKWIQKLSTFIQSQNAKSCPTLPLSFSL